MSVDLNALGKGIHRHIQEQDFQFGVQAERERIIKLLEITNLPCCGCMQDSEFILKLIKGENK